MKYNSINYANADNTMTVTLLDLNDKHANFTQVPNELVAVFNSNVQHVLLSYDASRTLLSITPETDGAERTFCCGNIDLALIAKEEPEFPMDFILRTQLEFALNEPNELAVSAILAALVNGFKVRVCVIFK